tara:strand:- start:11102 stop:11683 length:582 start_codon:yes stop_codon:yes gene_type:complete
MYKLYTDKQEIFECEIQLEGTTLDKSEARLVIETNDMALLFKGNIDSKGKCKIPVKKLKGLLSENAKGSIKLEVIADDVYFTPWESNFNVETSKKVTVEVKSQQNDNVILEGKPKVSIKGIKSDNKVIKESEKKHVLNILKLLIKENINVENVSMRKNKLNHIVATYLDSNPINENQKNKIVNGVISGLSKLK